MSRSPNIDVQMLTQNVPSLKALFGGKKPSVMVVHMLATVLSKMDISLDNACCRLHGECVSALGSLLIQHIASTTEGTLQSIVKN